MDQIKLIEVEFQSDFEEQLWIRISLRGKDSLLIGLSAEAHPEMQQ